jgi:hypothetical protein
MCGACEAGFQDIFGVCTPCEQSNGGLVFFMVLGSFALVIGIYWNESRMNNTGSLAIVFYYTQIILLIVGPMSEWTRWLHIFSADASSVSLTSCVVQQSEVNQNIMMPFYVFLLFCAAGAVCSVLYPALRLYSERVPSLNPNLQVRAAISLFLFNYTGLLQAGFSAFFCVDVGGGQSVLFMYPSISCQSEAYRAAFAFQVRIPPPLLHALATFVVTVYRSFIFNCMTSTSAQVFFVVLLALVTPLCVLFVTQCAQSITSVEVLIRVGPLIQQYRKSTAYYQAIVMLRRILYSLFDIWLSFYPILRGIVISLLAITFLVIHMGLRPFAIEVTIWQMCGLFQNLFSINSFLICLSFLSSLIFL